MVDASQEAARSDLETFAELLLRLRVCEKMQSAGKKWKQHVEAG